MIVVGGEALVDLVPDQVAPPGELARLAPRLGGGPYNVAVALGRLGSRTSLLSRISRDGFGEALVERLRGSGVDTSRVQRGPEPTTLAVVSRQPDGSASYGFYTEGTADRLVADPGPLGPEVRAVSLGTLSLVLEPGATTYETVLRRESTRGAFVTLDPNIRPELIADPEAYRERFRGWLPHVDLLKLSVEDAAWLGETSPDDATTQARRWAALGPAAVVLTHGANGISVVTRTGGDVAVPGQPTELVDTIGAGDTVQAALLHWLNRHDALTSTALTGLSTEQWCTALDFAARVAAVTCSRPGADPPHAHELDRA
ncbi:carbohydrate kinase [Lipingzhangella sp. LS1_29]|uniref:Carbohydrate kinase n=1 Tax=Lipingzhangella rawalii TaxID=2055835 RepID=A0ABU2H4A5_9ACTN|nr:carbohydrate kinase [Lipingzhangella rawalii]MDS1270131.1 carbohydrate kinase [Lipingzhangella rawalii]